MAKQYSSLTDIQADLKAASVTVRELVETCLQQARQYQHLNAFNEVFEQEALQQAEALDKRLKNQEATGKLAGMVISIKDNICYKGHQVTASSKILHNFTSVYSSTIVERLLAEDAIIIGRCNCDEFAMGATNESSYYGPVKNQADETRVAGGSSGGSAVSVQAGMCHAAIGTDTGGSVRQPAAFCGVIGFKPTYGSISRHGVIAYASSFDQPGIVANTIDDVALLLEVLAGADEYDSTLSQRQVPAYAKELHPAEGKKKIGYLKEALENTGTDEEIKQAMTGYLNALRNEGHTVEPVSFRYLEYIVPAYYILAMAEASSNLARYDGVHYGYRSPQATDLMSTYKKSRSEGFGKEVKRRIMLGTFVLSAGYYDAYYAKAQKIRRLIKEETDHLLTQYNFIVLPTAPEVAFELSQTERDPVSTYLADIYTVQASLAGIPAISLPAGTGKQNLPLSVQVLGHRFGEQELLNFSKYSSKLI